MYLRLCRMIFIGLSQTILMKYPSDWRIIFTHTLMENMLVLHPQLFSIFGIIETYQHFVDITRNFCWFTITFDKADNSTSCSIGESIAGVNIIGYDNLCSFLKM